MNVEVLKKLTVSSFLLTNILVSGIAHAEDRVYTLPTNSTKVQSDKSNTTKSSLKLTGQIGDTAFANEQGERNQSVSFIFGEEFKHTLTETLKVNVESKLYTFAGQSLSKFGDGIPTNGIYLKEALVSWQPLKFLALDAGALNQKYLNSKLLIDDKAFPAARESATLRTGKFTGTLSAEQAIPTSASLSTKTADRETNPSFFAETLSGKIEVMPSLNFELFGSLFEFKDLPSQVAFDSSLYGNTPNSLASISSSKFAYDFGGWLLGAKTEIGLAKLQKIIISGHMIENMLAPTAYNHGQIVSLGGEFGLNNDLSINPSFETFFNESDSAPAYYNDFLYGHNNRQGYATRLTLDFKNYNFKLTGVYADSDVINLNINQSRQQVFILRLETAYDVF